MNQLHNVTKKIIIVLELFLFLLLPNGFGKTIIFLIPTRRKKNKKEKYFLIEKNKKSELFQKKSAEFRRWAPANQRWGGAFLFLNFIKLNDLFLHRNLHR
jgi:hypothetical protein